MKRSLGSFRLGLVFAIGSLVMLPACSSDTPQDPGGEGGQDQGGGGKGGSKASQNNGGKGGGGSKGQGGKGGANAGGSHAGGSNENAGTANNGGANKGGSKNTGGSNKGGSTNNGGAGKGGSSNNGGKAGSTNVAGGGPADGGTAGGSNPEGGGPSVSRPNGCTAGAELISDFEEGTGTVIQSGDRDGWWYVYADSNSGSQTPPSVEDAAVVAAELPAADQKTCQKYAMHSTASGHPEYVGFGAALRLDENKKKKPVDVSAYAGVKFRAKSGSGSQSNIWFEVQNVENMPPDLDGTAKTTQVDEYNTHGVVLPEIGSTWTDVYVPFGLMASKYLPGGCTDSGVLCQAPMWNPKSVLGIQFSVDPQVSSKAGGYDLWIDDVQFYTGTEGYGAIEKASGALPFPRDTVGSSCVKATGSTGRQVIALYNKWKAKFVQAAGSNAAKVVSPEIDGGATVSEGIAYGMLLAANMGDRDLFDKLWTYWKDKSKGVGGDWLMNWKIDSSGNVSGPNSATDADEDAAFALLVADKQWGGDYRKTAESVIGAIWTSDIVSGDVTGGSSYKNAMNPSYFAPAYYRVFAKVDTGHDWDGVASKVYTRLKTISSSSAAKNGLVPAWCAFPNCDGPGNEHGDDSRLYQYDSHRVPWRIGIDVCTSSAASADATDYLKKVVGFFADAADKGGIGSIFDKYTSADAKPLSNAANNAMSPIGCAGAGAMATKSQKFLDAAYEFIFSASLTPNTEAQTKGYTYYNATVGVLTALTMSGNFYVPQY